MWFQLKGPGDPEQGQQRDVPLTSLDTPDVSSVQTGKMPQLVLRKADGLPPLSNTIAQRHQQT